MDLWQLKPGDAVRTADGALVAVVSKTEDGRWIRVRYLADPENPAVEETEDLCQADVSLPPKTSPPRMLVFEGNGLRKGDSDGTEAPHHRGHHQQAP